MFKATHINGIVIENADTLRTLINVIGLNQQSVYVRYKKKLNFN